MQKAGLAGLAFRLGNHLDTVTVCLIGQYLYYTVVRNASKVLIVLLANIRALLPVFIAPNDDPFGSTANRICNDAVCCLVDG